MLIPSYDNSTPAESAKLDVSYTCDPNHSNLVTLKPAKILPRQFSRQSLVYVAHAILIVAALGMMNWLYATSPVSLHSQSHLSEQLIDWQVAQD